MYIFFYDIEYFYKKNFQIALYSVIVAIINIVLNFIFINKFGYQAAAYTTLVSYLLLLIFHYFGMKLVENRKIYDIKYMLYLIIILILVLFLFIFSNYNILLRYTFLTFVLIVMFIKYKDVILNILKKRRKKI